MNSRLSKEVLIKMLKELKISSSEFTILSSGALVLREILKDAGDLDIAVTEKGFDELKKNYNLINKHNDWYIVTDKVECVVSDMANKREKIGYYFVQDINDYLDYLQSSNRLKDLSRIPLVKKYILERKN